MDDDDVIVALTTAQVAELVRVSYRQLDHWVGKGYLTIGEPHPGSGGHRRWLPDDVMRARVFAELVHAGVRPESITEALPTAALAPTLGVVQLGRLTITWELT